MRLLWQTTVAMLETPTVSSQLPLWQLLATVTVLHGLHLQSPQPPSVLEALSHQQLMHHLQTLQQHPLTSLTLSVTRMEALVPQQDPTLPSQISSTTQALVLPVYQAGSPGMLDPRHLPLHQIIPTKLEATLSMLLIRQIMVLQLRDQLSH